eukprot:3505481-Pyramimonas_sp.AAC.1
MGPPAVCPATAPRGHGVVVSRYGGSTKQSSWRFRVEILWPGQRMCPAPKAPASLAGRRLAPSGQRRHSEVAVAPSFGLPVYEDLFAGAPGQ